jgi:polyphenol oxidase
MALTASAPFTVAGDHIAVDLGHGARGLFTTRLGGVSAPPFDTLNLGRWTDDDPAAVEENRRRVLALTGCDAFAQGRQVHGAHVARTSASAPPGETSGTFADADGQATALDGVAAIVLTADCLPVLLAADGAVAAVHAGWRGLAAGVLEEGIAALRDVGGSGPITAAIGPAACGRCYEVGDEVRAAFGMEPAGGPEPIDLKAIARERLDDATVYDVGLCTMHDEPFFSHRADGGVTGRQAGVVWR